MADPIKRATETSKNFLEQQKRRAQQGPSQKKKKIQRFPGDFKNFQESEEKKQSLIEAEKKFQKDKQHPVKGKHAAFDRLVNAGKKEVEAFKNYRKNRADTQDKARVQNMAKGGRAGYKSGTRGCKLAMKGKGKAYGKNS